MTQEVMSKVEQKPPFPPFKGETAAQKKCVWQKMAGTIAIHSAFQWCTRLTHNGVTVRSFPKAAHKLWNF
jgi:hypothetical protein